MRREADAATATARRCAARLDAAGFDGESMPASSAATARRGGCIISTSTTRAPTDGRPPPHPAALIAPRSIRATLAEIRRAAATGIYDIRGGGAKRKLPHFDDLLFLGAAISRYPLEGYRERCGTDVVLGARHAKKPIELKIPITIAGMSFGALSAQAKEALGRGATHRRHLAPPPATAA